MITPAAAERLMDRRVTALDVEGTAWTGLLIAHGTVLDGGEDALVLTTPTGETLILTLRTVATLRPADPV